MVVVYVLVYLTCRRLWVDNVVSKVVLVFLASCVKAVAVLAVSALFGAFEGDWGPAMSSMLRQRGHRRRDRAAAVRIALGGPAAGGARRAMSSVGASRLGA